MKEGDRKVWRYGQRCARFRQRIEQRKPWHYRKELVGGGDVNGGLDNSGDYHDEGGEGFNNNDDGSGDNLGYDERDKKKMVVTMVFTIQK